MPSSKVLAALVMLSSLSAVVVAPRSAAADEGGSPIARLDRAASVECGSTAASSNLSCKLLDSVRACQRGDADGCEVVAKVSMTRDVHDVPRATATPFFLLRSCSLVPDKCIGFVKVAMRWLGDPAFALALLEAGCTRSTGVCRAAASMYVIGREVPGSRAVARDFARRACARGDASSCVAATAP